MAQTITISQKELQRVAALAYEGKTLKVMLCSVGATGYTAQSTVANWQSVEKSGNGYSRFTATIGTGSYNGTEAAYVMPDIDAAFTATSTGYSYDTVVIYINGETFLHSIIVESPNVTLVAGQTQTYRISLRQDD
jgi:hypothetical protein